jgi:hypothetical protein
LRRLDVAERHIKPMIESKEQTVKHTREHTNEMKRNMTPQSTHIEAYRKVRSKLINH